MKKYFYTLSALVLFSLIFHSCKKDDDENKLNIDKAYCAESPTEVYMCTEIPSDAPKESTNNQLRAVMLNGIRWEVGQTIKIKFLNGRRSAQEKVKKYGSMWLEYANLKFEFVDIDDYADVKIAFKWDCDYTTWSRLGIDCKKCDQYSPSVNFGWIDETSSEREIKRVVLHEFGHILGLIHEHQHPEAEINWDKEIVYSYYEIRGWDQKTVDINIFNKYSVSQTNFSQFDNQSVMLYAIAADFTLDGYSIPWNYELSETDKSFINSIYPF